MTEHNFSNSAEIGDAELIPLGKSVETKREAYLMV